MFSNIEKLQKKPDYIKRRITLFTALILFLIIVAFWFSMGDIEPPKQKDINLVGDTSSPVENFKSIFTGIKNEAEIKLDSLKKQYPFSIDVFE